MSEEKKTETRAITRRAGIVAAGTLTSRLLGLIREQALAAAFSRSATDVFFVAFLIPNVLRQLLAEGAAQTAIVPVLGATQAAEGEAKTAQAYAAIRGAALLALLVVSAAGVLLAPELVALFAGGFAEEPGKLERTITITRWVFPYIFFMGNAALGMAALTTHRRFVVVAFAPGLLNVAFIAAALALPTWLLSRGQDPLMALVVGVLAGGILQVVAQWPSLKRIGYLTLPRIDFTNPALLQVLRRMAPVLLSFGVYYVDVVVARHLLSTMGEGAPSYFTFAQRLCDFPQGIFVMAVQTATLPSLAGLAGKHDRTALVATYQHGLRLALFAAIPASALLFVLSEPVVSLVFERGHFDAMASQETGAALAAQATGIVFVAAVRQTVIVFYALGDTKTPAAIAFLDFLVFLGAAWLLKGPLGHVGISWAVSFSSVAQLALLLVALRLRVRRLLSAALARSLLTTVAASAVAAAGAWACSRTLSDNRAAIAGGLVFGFVFLGSAALMRSPELRDVLRPLRRLAQRRRVQ